MQTIADIKRDLPPVRCSWHGSKYWARVSGRLNRFATVSPYERIDSGKRSKVILGPCFDVAWDTVASVINKDGVIRLD